MIRLLDLFCGAGGAAMGYHRAFEAAGIEHEIVGVDNRPMPRYPFTFVEADAMEYPMEGFDVIHASPPCQGYSTMRFLPWLRDKKYPRLIEPTRARLQESGAQWIIENVMGAQREAAMHAGWLCGLMFGLPFPRHRLFQSSFFWLQPGHPKHGLLLNLPMGHATHKDIGRHRRQTVNEAQVKSRTVLKNGAQKVGANVGHAAGFAVAKEAMQIDWMTRDELTQAVPPVMTQFIGEQLLRVIGDNSSAWSMHDAPTTSTDPAPSVSLKAR